MGENYPPYEYDRGERRFILKKTFVTPTFGKIEYEERLFESQCFKNKTLEILDWQSEYDDINALFHQFETAEKLKKGDLLFTRFDVNNAKKSKEARDCGFYFMEVSIAPFIMTKDWDEKKFVNEIFKMEKIGPDRIEEVLLIGESTLTGLRFNRDDNIGEDLARERYRNWLRNAYNSGQDVAALIFDDEIVGFMLIRYDSPTTATWILGGIKPGSKGKGYGLKTYVSALAYCKQKGIEEIHTGISVGNIPVLNLYSKLGFKFRNPEAVMHYVIK